MDRDTPDVKASNGDSGLVQFAGITYTLADAGAAPDTGLVYAYTIREEIPDGAVQNADGSWLYNNIVYSGDVKQVFVHVFTTAEIMEGEKVQVVNANVYSTDSENGESREDGDIYYISGFTNTYTPDNPPDNPSTPGDDDDDDDDDGDRTDDTPPPPTEEEPPVPVLPELPNPNEPDSPDVVTIFEDDVPTTYVKVQDPETEEFIYIPEDDIPLYGFEVPETGDSGKTTLWAFLSTASLIGVVGLHLAGRKRREDEE